MAGTLLYLIPVVMIAVVFVLARGLAAFTREGEESRRQSNRMMQWRIALQFLAIVLVMLFIFLTQGGPG